MLLYRLGPEGFYAVVNDEGEQRWLFSDPLETPPAEWQMGRALEGDPRGLLAPVVAPSKILGIGRNYARHARELGNPVPEEPVLFLKAPSTLIGPEAAILLPPESEQVEFEGEIAVILGRRLCRASDDEARAAILGVSCACDVTARDLQRRDATFARAKSFDTFCPLGPALLLDPDLESLTVETRVNGELRQRGTTAEMLWSIPELLAYASRMMSLEVGDVVLTGTPEGVGRLVEGDSLEVEVSGVGVLRNRVESRWGG
jgi:2-keto-4-pentenoate hydratase/2-oxohepta-3-ene-1,7-dioic acid hydratase in catechol pathway